MNRADLIGHLGKDPEVRATQTGTKVVTFSIATSERWKDKDTGERKESTEWHNVVIFNEALCDIAERFLKKGSKARVCGTIRTRKWQDKSGTDRWTTEIVLPRFRGEIELLDAADRAPAPSENAYGTAKSTEGNTYAATKNGTGQAPAPGAGKFNDIDDDMPF